MKKIVPPLAILALVLSVLIVWNIGIKGSFLGGGNADEQDAAAPIGGSFTLVDQTGKTVRDSDFHGHLMLVFFGFTQCPDICPVTTATLSKTLDLLGDKAGEVSALFITVDPERDTPAALKTYLSNFNPHLIGLTGTQEQIKDVALAYKVYFAKVGAPWDEAGDESDHHENAEESKSAPGENYVVDHSTFIYLMDKNGKYITHFSYDADPQEIADAISLKLQ